MPAIMPNDLLALPRLPRPDTLIPDRTVVAMVDSPSFLEGAGFPVRRPFPSREVSFKLADPFLLLDHMGAVEYGPGEAKGAPWHPHRGFETVTYIIDGAFEHHDSHGGGGFIQDGDTQWMTAGSGILHDEMPPEDLVRKGGLFHGVQLWVNLPQKLKMTPPRYQDISGSKVTLLTSHDGASVIRLIAGELSGHQGPGMTHSPIVYAHATVFASSELRIFWPESYNAMVYVLSGHGYVGTEHTSIREGQLAVFGPGSALTVSAQKTQDAKSPSLEVLLLGGQPINEPIAQYGPFVMNTHQEIVQAFDDYQQGRMGSIPAARTPKS